MTATTAGVLTNIFTAPQAAFAAIKERPSPWLPLLAVILSTCIVQFAYTQVVDLASEALDRGEWAETRRDSREAYDLVWLARAT